MVRPLLIALLTLAAVAWPGAAASLGPVPAPEGLPVPRAVDVSTTADLERTLDFVDQRLGAVCRPVQLDWESSDGPLPDVGYSLDPDHCLSALINDAVALVLFLVEYVWPLVDEPAAVDINGFVELRKPLDVSRVLLSSGTSDE